MFDFRRTGKTRTIVVLVFALSLLLSVTAFCAEVNKGTIAGHVEDASGAALQGARIELQPLGASVVSDKQGDFSFIDVAPGSYKLTVSSVGFKLYETDIALEAGAVKHLTSKLEVASKKEEIIVTAERPHGEAEAINRTRTADNLVQVLPSDVITSLPNANVADAIGRLPSVALYRIEGEGVYLQLRGTEPRLTNVTVDGITIPATDPQWRQARLDVIPSDLVESVEINKTLSANQDADGIGGSVNLVTKTAGEQPFFTIGANGGYTPILDGRGASQVDSTWGQRFLNKKLGVLLNGTWDYNGRGIDNIQPGLDPRSTFAQPFYDNDTIRDYRYYRNRYGITGSADYKLNDVSSLYLRGIYSNLQDYGDKWYYEPQSTAISSTGALPSLTAASPSPKFYTSSKRPDVSVGSVNAGGHHVFTSSWMTWELSASRSTMLDSAGNPKADFSWLGPKVYCNYSPAAQLDIYRPTFGSCDAANSPLMNASLWALKDLTTSTGMTAQLNLTAATSYAKNYRVGSHFATFETGFKIRNSHKSQDATENVYDGWSTSTTPGILMSNLMSGFQNTDFYNGSYFGGQFGPVSDFTKAQNFVLNNLVGYLDPYKTAAATYPNIFDLVERITAGYMMNTIDLGKLRVQTGLRFEGTQMGTLGYNVVLNSSGGGTPVPVTNNPTYLDVLPSVQARYALTDNDNIRAVYSRGVARPDPYQMIPYVTEDDTASPVAVDVGNPNLKPEHANNYDLLYEKFLKPMGMFQAGVFFKQLTAPEVVTTIPGGVNLATLPGNYLSPAMQSVIAQYPGDAVTMYINGKNSYLYGLELSYQQHLTFLPSAFHSLGVAANYSYTASKEKGLPFRTDSPALQMQTPNVWNIGPTYDTRKLSVRMGLSYNGPCIFQYEWIPSADVSGLGPKGPSGDIYTYSHMQVDAQASYHISRSLTAMVYGLNLTNEVFGYYQGSPQFVNQREYYKPTYAGGLRYTFNGER